jgi:hypothetical protein
VAVQSITSTRSPRRHTSAWAGSLDHDRVARKSF